MLFGRIIPVLWKYLKSAYAVAKMDKVRNTITVSTFADPSAFAFVYNKIINPIAFQKNTRACGVD